MLGGDAVAELLVILQKQEREQTALFCTGSMQEGLPWTLKSETPGRNES